MAPDRMRAGRPACVRRFVGKLLSGSVAGTGAPPTAMRSGGHPLMAALSEDAFSYDVDHFAFGLQRLLDGFGVLVERRAGG
ncbi:hypothetical protein ACF1BU_00375 [Streptomyces sp. NPDC014724]|uniref:hypothetical protein n=1 Tax=unclassified Streptomyces TaxID=2593676 RepID=UPI0036FDA776